LEEGAICPAKEINSDGMCGEKIENKGKRKSIIKKAWLRLHPDKNLDCKEQANSLFQLYNNICKPEDLS